MRKSLIADGALVLVAMSWGLNFVITKNALSDISPYMYLGIRFFVSTLLMAIIFHKQIKKITKEDIKGGLVIGLFLFLGFITQTVGLVYTTPSKSGFITGSNVVMVPFLAYGLTKEFPGTDKILGAVVTFAGLGLISLSENLTINLGDSLTLVCAVCFALQIIFTEYYVKKGNPINIAFVQIGFTGVFTTLMALIFEPMPVGFEMKTWGAILFGALFCTVGAYAIQNTAQKYTSSSHAAVIMY